MSPVILGRSLDLSVIALLVGRSLVALLFVLAGFAKVTGPQPFLDHMNRFAVPTLLLPAVIVLELGGGLWLMSGYRVRYPALALGLFCVLTAAIFHHDLDNKVERSLFFKDLAISGGLFVIASLLTSNGRH